jgi:hypothetical protein
MLVDTKNGICAIAAKIASVGQDSETWGLFEEQVLHR